MEIRFVARRDFDGVRDLFLQVHAIHVGARADIYADVEPFTRAEFEEMLSAEQAFTLVAEDNDNIVGFTSVTLRKPPNNRVMLPRKVAFMDDLCVDSRCRRRGVGEALFNAAKAEAAKRGAQNMELMVWAFNAPAIEFYKKNGMRTRSEILETPL